MPPKALRRPAGVIRAIGKAAARPKAGAKVRVRPARRDRRGGGVPVAPEAAEFEVEKFNAGEEVEGRLVPSDLWKKGTKVVFSDALYWEERIQASGEVQHLEMDGGQKKLIVNLLGTQAESLVKWKGANPDKFLVADLCQPDCIKGSKDGLIHVNKLMLWTARGEKDWMRNLDGMAPPEDEMEALRRRGEDLGDEMRRKKALPADASSSSGSKKKKKKKKKSKKRKKDAPEEKEEGRKVQGTKDLTAVFGKTGLDPSGQVRKQMMRRAKKVAKKKSKKDSSSTSGSSGSGDTDSQGGESSGIFGEEARIKTVWNRIPGVLTMQTLNQMQMSLVRQSGQPWELSQSHSHVPPIFSQYWRMFLYGKVTGPMNREIQSICFAQDLLLQGKVAQACDVLMQRLKSLEQTAGGGDYKISLNVKN